MNSSTPAEKSIIDTLYQLDQELKQLRERVARLESFLSIEASAALYDTAIPEFDEEAFKRQVEKALFSIPVPRPASGTIGQLLDDPD